jgi:hypothetical protein
MSSFVLAIAAAKAIARNRISNRLRVIVDGVIVEKTSC